MAKTPPPSRPVLFLGSSTEGLPIAEALQRNLGGDVEVRLWKQGMARPSSSVLADLLEQRRRVDCAAVVLTQDDRRTSRGSKAAVPRDNLIFELVS